MKIALFTNYPRKDGKLQGGVPAVAVCLAKTLSEIRGMQVHIITFDKSLKKVISEYDGNVTVHRLPMSSWPQILDLQYGPGRKFLEQYVKQLNPDILHTHETHGLMLSGFPFPHLHTIHGFDRENIIAGDGKLSWCRSFLWGVVERRAIAKHRFLISITPYVRHQIESLTRARIFDIENPVDSRFFQVERHETKGRILSVGWISERKNTLATVKAFAEVVASGLESELIIAGTPFDHKYYEKVVKYIREKSLNERVQFLGHINHDQLLKELSKACMLVLPSRQENAPMVIAEAMAAGIPVISTNRCGMPYMIREGITGFLIEPDDLSSLCRHMISLLTDDSLRRAMGYAGHREAEERFHPNVIAKKTVEVYETVLGSGSSK